MGALCSVHYRKEASVCVGETGQLVSDAGKTQRRSPEVAALAPSTVPALGSVAPVVPEVGLAPGAPVLPLVIEPLELPEAVVPIESPLVVAVVVLHAARAVQAASIVAVVNRFMVIPSE